MNILYLLLWFTGFIVYQFKMRNSQIKSFAEGLVLVFGSWSHGFGVLLMVVYLLFVMAAHIVGFSLMVTTIWPNTMCNIVYKVVASLLYLVATCRRSFNAGKLIYFACKYFISSMTYSSVSSFKCTLLDATSTDTCQPAHRS